MEFAAGDLAKGESVAGELLVSEELEVYFKNRPERVTLIGSDGIVVRQADSLKGC